MAQSAVPPQAVAMYLDEVEQHPNSIAAYGNLTFSLSPDDPNQLDGSLQYSLYQNTTYTGPTLCGAASGTVSDCGWVRTNITGQAHVPLRPGWVKVPVSFSISTAAPVCNEGSSEGVFSVFDCAFNLTAWRSNIESDPSCQINLTLNRNRSQSQCGSNITEPPAGIAAIIHTVPNATQEGLVQAKWPISEDDPYNVTGNFTYRLWITSITDRGDAFTLLNDTDPNTTGLDLGGNRYYNLSIGGTAKIPLELQARAEDPALLLYSNWTCQVIIHTNIYNDVGSCNGVTPFDALGNFSDTPLFPGIRDVIGLGVSFGVPEGAVIWFFAAIWTILVGGIGMYAFNLPGLIGGLILGVVSSAMFGLLPQWFIVILFLLAGAVIVFLAKSGGSEA